MPLKPLLVFVFSLSLLAASTLLNGMAAQVGKTAITLQDVYIYRALQRFRDGVIPSVLIEEGEALKKTVQKTMFEQMVLQEMQAAQFEGGSKKDAEAIIQKRKTGKGLADWNRLLAQFQLSESQVVERLYKTLQAEKFLERKVQTLTPIITDVEIEKYVKQNEARFKNSRWQELKPQITNALKQERTEKGLQEWIRFLTEKYSATSFLE